MLSWIWIAVMPALVFPFSGAGQQPTADEKPVATGFLCKTLTFDGQTYPYCVYVPPEYTRAKPWPVILFLHGSGESGRDGLLQTEVGIGRAIRRHRRDFPAIVVMPQAPPDQRWVGKMAKMALHCVEQTSHEYHLDAERVYLTGLSLGGYGTWTLGAEYANRFAAIVPVCGFIELGQSTGLAAKVAPALADMPIWCFHGSADPNVPVQKAREMVAEIRKLGGNVKYTEYEGGGHNVWDRAYDDRELWKWLFSQKLSCAKTPSP